MSFSKILNAASPLERECANLRGLERMILSAIAKGHDDNAYELKEQAGRTLDRMRTHFAHLGKKEGNVTQK